MVKEAGHGALWPDVQAVAMEPEGQPIRCQSVFQCRKVHTGHAWLGRQDVENAAKTRERCGAYMLLAALLCNTTRRDLKGSHPAEGSGSNASRTGREVEAARDMLILEIDRAWEQQRWN